MRAVLAAWRAHDEQSKRLREQAFRIDLGPTSLPPTEQLSHAVKRGGRQSAVPVYDAESDPHLVKFHRARLAAERRSHSSRSRSRTTTATSSGFQGRKGSQHRGADQLASTAPQGYRPASANRTITTANHRDLLSKSAHDHVASTFMGCPTSKDHVLSLKQIFFRFSVELYGVACRKKGCPVQANGEVYEKVRLIPVKALDLTAVIQLGLSVTNEHRKKNHQVPIPSSMEEERLYHWLVMLDCKETLDWMSFLLLCTCHSVRDFKLLAELKTMFDAFPGGSSETAYHDLLASMINTESVKKRTGGDEASSGMLPASPPNFFQPGDLFKYRHHCSFADTLYSLMPHCVQGYLSYANARGFNLLTNFGGHAAHHDMVAEALSQRREAEARGEAPTTSEGTATALKLKPPKIPPSRNMKAEFIGEQAARLRYENRVWC